MNIDRLGRECRYLQETERHCFCSFPDRGIGRSRNEAILRAEGDICLFSDADIVYEDGYEAAVLAEFERNPRADMIIFNIEVEEERRTYPITERKPVRWYNCGRYGAVSLLYAERAATIGNHVFPVVWRRCKIQ
ncbi:MAG: glycosyltransferase family A protein [Waltera sp.]